MIQLNKISYQTSVLVKQPTVSKQVRFSSIGLNRPDDENINPHEILKYRAPKPLRFLQDVMFLVNRHILMRGLDLKLSPEDIQTLQSVPQEAGNIFIVPHPDMNDGFILVRLMELARRYPSGMLMASEEMAKRKWMIPAFQYAGVLPVRRGKPNTEALEHLTEKISEGGCIALAPEGMVYLTREVMPMEQGFLRIAIDAALKSQQRGKNRPVFVTPTAIAYRYKNPKQAQAAMMKSLAELENHPQLFKTPQSGDFADRLTRVGHLVVGHKIVSYGVSPSVFAFLATHPDPLGKEALFQKAQILKTYLLEDLEKRYLGQVQTGFEKRRTLKIRMRVYNQLQHNPQQKAALIKDLAQINDINYLIPLHQHPADPYEDLETQSRFLRRYRQQMGMSSPPYGHRIVTTKVLPPRDVRPLAQQFDALKTPAAKNHFLSQQTELIRQEMQQAVMTLLP